MKNILASLLAVTLLISFSTISFAQHKVSKMETLSGKIVSIDTAKKEVTIQETSGAQKTFSADAKQISSLKTDEWVKVNFKSGSNTAETIKDITKKHNKS